MYLGDGQLCVREMHGINDRKRESRCPEFCKREVIPQSVLWLQWTRYSHSKTELHLQWTSKYLVKTIWYVTFEGHYVLIRTKSICCISSVLKVYLFLSIMIRLFQYTVKWRLKTIMTLLNSKKKKIMNKKNKNNKKNTRT